MNVSIWDPFREMEALFNNYSMPARKKSTADENGTVETRDWAPVVDILESENDFVLKVELPGVEKDDVDVSIDNRILTIKGEKKNDTTDKKVHRTECRYGTFIRNFNLHPASNPKCTWINNNAIFNAICISNAAILKRQIHIFTI